MGFEKQIKNIIFDACMNQAFQKIKEDVPKLKDNEFIEVTFRKGVYE